MKKTWKRLCTGFLALATVVTALPTTPVHAESKQYWTESKERVGIVEKVMNDGSIGSTFNEGHLTVEGEDAYCIDIKGQTITFKEKPEEPEKPETPPTPEKPNRPSDSPKTGDSTNVKLNINYMLHEDYGHYSYTEHYSLGDIFIYTSADEEKGVLLELKGRGCRQFESYLLAQQRSWYDFLMDALVDGGVMKRIDLAINDHTGILDIPELAEKCRKREYIGKSRSYKFYQSGELIKHREDDREYMGRTLYLGSLKSDVYFCIYEKDYEQYVKLGTPLEEADIINRFEIRLRNERAYYAVRDLLTYYDAEQTAFSIINQYVRFVDEEPDKRKNDWKLNDRWAWFIGDNRQSLKLTTKPEPYTLDRTLRWVQRQVAPTLKMLKKIDKGNGTDYMETIEQQAKLTEKHEMIIKQQTTPAKDLVES